ncbi:MAG: GIY-YIG nuclease family protein [Mesorhizobium sp.]|nr:MAG: GIY-YIG nuclease family protein [Mesorhizobium sp.]
MHQTGAPTKVSFGRSLRASLPMRLTFQRRQDVAGVVYICSSKTLKLLKIGSSTDHSTRARKLNFEGYAGTTDWRLIYWARVANAGRVESMAHSKLNSFVRRLPYRRDGHPQTAYECFTCSISAAINALVDFMQEDEPFEHWKGR